MRDNKWTTSLNGEIFNGECFDTPEEAIKYMTNNLDIEGLKKGYWIGQVKKCFTSQFIDCENIIENAQCQADDVAGESAEDYLTDVTPKQIDELNKLVRKWFDDNGFAPTFYSIKNVRKIQV